MSKGKVEKIVLDITEIPLAVVRKFPYFKQKIIYYNDLDADARGKVKEFYEPKEKNMKWNNFLEAKSNLTGFLRLACGYKFVQILLKDPQTKNGQN